MGINKRWFKGQSFARSIVRQIDRETLMDLLGLVIYEANRNETIEDAGGSSGDESGVDCLFDYVLDAIGIQPESDSFSRLPFEIIFYNDYWLEKKYESLSHVLDALQALRDSFVERSSNAEAKRSAFRLVDSDR